MRNYEKMTQADNNEMWDENSEFLHFFGGGGESMPALTQRADTKNQLINYNFGQEIAACVRINMEKSPERFPF